MQGKLKFMYEAEEFLADFQFQLWCLAKDKIDMIHVEDHICVGRAGFNKPRIYLAKSIRPSNVLPVAEKPDVSWCSCQNRQPARLLDCSIHLEGIR